ncbi:MAG: hypothetical protein QOF60_3100 [Actinomycetota bacterium]|jgi:hypothetical protein|nr:hypothetical protein [Actinomycetota bacterium]
MTANDQNEPWTNTTVCIYGRDGDAVGHGVLAVLEDTIVTPAHVVEDAVNAERRGHWPSIKGKTLTVGFPFIDRDWRGTAVVGRVLHAKDADIANLRVTDIPTEAEPATIAPDFVLTRGMKLRGIAHRPNDGDTIFECRVQGNHDHCAEVQVLLSEGQDFLFEHGDSGDTLWTDDDENILGGILLRGRPGTKTGYIAPIGHVARIFTFGDRRQGTPDWQWDFFRGAVLKMFSDDLKAADPDGLSHDAGENAHNALSYVADLLSDAKPANVTWIRESPFTFFQNLVNAFDAWRSAQTPASRWLSLVEFDALREEFAELVHEASSVGRQTELAAFTEAAFAAFRTLCARHAPEFPNLAKAILRRDKAVRRLGFDI